MMRLTFANDVPIIKYLSIMAYLAADPYIFLGREKSWNHGQTKQQKCMFMQLLQKLG